MADGGTGVIFYPDGTVVTESVTTGTHFCNYKAEVHLPLTSTQMVKNSTTREYKQIAFLTDALSVLEALNSGN